MSSRIYKKKKKTKHMKITKKSGAALAAAMGPWGFGIGTQL